MKNKTDKDYTYLYLCFFILTLSCLDFISSKLRCNFVSCSLPAAGLLSAPAVFGWHAANGRGSRHHHCQRDASGEPRGTERVTGLGEVLGHFLHRGERSFFKYDSRSAPEHDRLYKKHLS